MQENEENKRTYKTSSLSDIARTINSRAFKRYGFTKSDILVHWGEIVGTVLARFSMPERLIFPRKNEFNDKASGVLYICVEGSFAPEMQHLEPLIIDRINAYYGFKAVERLVFRHGMINKNEIQQKYIEPILSDSQKKDLEDKLSGIKDSTLKTSLYKVGAELISRDKMQKMKQGKRFTRRGQGSAIKSSQS